MWPSVEIGVLDIGLRTLALCKRLHRYNEFHTPATYPRTLGTLGWASGVLRVVVDFNAKKHTRLRGCVSHIERRWADGLRCVENSEKPHR